MKYKYLLNFNFNSWRYISVRFLSIVHYNDEFKYLILF